MDGMGRMTKMTRAAARSLAPAARGKAGNGRSGRHHPLKAVSPFISGPFAESDDAAALVIFVILLILSTLSPPFPARS